MHRMSRARHNKRWHEAMANAPLSFPTVPADLIETISLAVAKQSSTLSELAAI